jgi:hypothetical protein
MSASSVSACSLLSYLSYDIKSEQETGERASKTINNSEGNERFRIEKGLTF